MEKQAKDIAADVTALERKIEFYNYNKTNQKQNNLGLTSEELKVILSKNDMKIKHIEDLTESILTKFTYERVENQDNSNIKTTNYKSCMVDRADLKILETKFVNQIEQLQEEMLQFINTATANEKELDARLRILENSETCNPAIYVSNTQKVKLYMYIMFRRWSHQNKRKIIEFKDEENQVYKQVSLNLKEKQGTIHLERKRQ